MAKRRFTERQTAEILRRAAQIQADRTAGKGGDGVAEDELRSAARELGIDGGAFDEAITSLDRPKNRGNAGFWGGPLMVEEDAVFSGKLSDDQWEETVADIRSALGEEGTLSQRGAAREWSGTGGGIDYSTFTVRERGESVRVSANSRMGGLALIRFMMACLATLMVIAFLGKPVHLPSEVEAAIGVSLALSFYLFTRLMVSRFSRYRANSLSMLVSRVGGRVEGSAFEFLADPVTGEQSLDVREGRMDQSTNS